VESEWKWEFSAVMKNWTPSTNQQHVVWCHVDVTDLAPFTHCS